MLISQNIESVRYYTSNSISTPYIEYQTIPQTNTNLGVFRDFDQWLGEGDTESRIQGLNFEILEQTFVTTINPSYYDEEVPGPLFSPPAGFSSDKVSNHPYPYLKVYVDPYPSLSNLIGSDIKAASSFHAIYINATATFVNNSVGITQLDSEYNSTSVLGHGIMFEHFGTRTPQLVPTNNLASIYEPRNSSEFVVLGKLNRRAYYPSVPTSEATPINDIQYQVNGYDNSSWNPIIWDQDESSFICCLSPNSLVNPSNPPFTGTIDDNPPYSIIVKGTYLLM